MNRYAEMEWRSQCMAAREIIIVTQPRKNRQPRNRQMTLIRRLLTIAGL